eukprot:Platyproteum_vivax@DN6925_c0_g1_i2.p1
MIVLWLVCRLLLVANVHSYLGHSSHYTKDKSVVPAPLPDCVVSDWSEWGACPVCTSTGREVVARHRQILTRGSNCPNHLVDSKDCEVPFCPTDCEMSAWSPWTSCPNTCQSTYLESGPVYKRRFREVTAAAFGGKKCFEKHLEERQECELAACEVGCQVSAWSNWDECNARCNEKGVETRRRKVLTSTRKNCPLLTQTRNCERLCSFDCEVSEWSEWSLCSECDFGKSVRSRVVVYDPARGGRRCPHLEEIVPCNVNGPPPCGEGAWPDPVNDCRCFCPYGWFGDPNPGGVCVPASLCAGNPCGLGGICSVGGPEGFTCTCGPGFFFVRDAPSMH